MKRSTSKVWRYGERQADSKRVNSPIARKDPSCVASSLASSAEAEMEEGWKDAGFWKTSFGRVWTGGCIWWLRALTCIFDVMIQETHPQVVASDFVHLDCG